MGDRSATAAAEGVVRVVENTMERAVRMITVERGRDPRSSVLVPFGGAAGLHACGLAESLGIHEILVPTHPGLLSAFGMLEAELVRDAYRALQIDEPSYEDIAKAASPLEKLVRRELATSGATRARIRIEAYAELRYAGEGSPLDVRLTRQFVRAFHLAHRLAFHSADVTRPIECCGVRVTGVAAAATPVMRQRSSRSVATTARRRKDVTMTLDGRRRTVPCRERSTLRASDRLTGPALVTEYSSTLLLLPGWSLRLDGHDNLRVQRVRS
jgi:N-methylhydantoinase A